MIGPWSVMLGRVVLGVGVLCAVVGCDAKGGGVDPEEARYCGMVARWKADAAAGIAPKNRTGWPPYQGECR